MKCPKCESPFMVPAAEIPEAKIVYETPSPSSVQQSRGETSTQPKGEKTLITSRPSMFRNRPGLFVVCVLLILAYGAGLFILLVWWLQCAGTTLIVTTKGTTFRRGILSKATTEVRHQDVRNVQITQSFFQRILGVGKIGISSAGQAGVEIEIAGIPRPEKIKAVIDEYRD